MQDIMAYVEELTRRAAKRKEPSSAPLQSAAAMSKPEAALEFVNHCQARLVRACPTCCPNTAADYLVLVPQANDTPEFRAALVTLRIPYPVVLRRDPLAYLPAICQHVREGRP